MKDEINMEEYGEEIETTTSLILDYLNKDFTSKDKSYNNNFKIEDVQFIEKYMLTSKILQYTVKTLEGETIRTDKFFYDVRNGYPRIRIDHIYYYPQIILSNVLVDRVSSVDTDIVSFDEFGNIECGNTELNNLLEYSRGYLQETLFENSRKDEILTHISTVENMLGKDSYAKYTPWNNSIKICINRSLFSNKATTYTIDVCKYKDEILYLLYTGRKVIHVAQSILTDIAFVLAEREFDVFDSISIQDIESLIEYIVSELSFGEKDKCVRELTRLDLIEDPSLYRTYKMTNKSIGAWYKCTSLKEEEGELKIVTQDNKGNVSSCIVLNENEYKDFNLLIDLSPYSDDLLIDVIERFLGIEEKKLKKEDSPEGKSDTVDYLLEEIRALIKKVEELKKLLGE